MNLQAYVATYTSESNARRGAETLSKLNGRHVAAVVDGTWVAATGKELHRLRRFGCFVTEAR